MSNHHAHRSVVTWINRLLLVIALWALTVVGATADSYSAADGEWSSPTVFNPTPGSSDNVYVLKNVTIGSVSDPTDAAHANQVIIGGGGYTGSLTLEGAGSLTATTLELGVGTFTLNSGGTFHGTIVLPGGGTGGPTLFVLGNGATLGTGAELDLFSIYEKSQVDVETGNVATISSPIKGAFFQSTPIPGALMKVGGGTLVLSGTNTYSGGTEVSGGELQVDSNTALGTGDVTVDSDATLSLNNTVTIGNTITISGTGSTGQGALFGASGSSAVTGTVNLATDASVGLAGTSHLTVGPINLSSHMLTLAAGSGNLYLNGSIPGGGGLLFNSTNIEIKGGNNTFTGTSRALAGSYVALSDGDGTAISGDLTIENGATVQEILGGQLGANTVLTLNGNGKLLFLGAPSNFSETIAGLSGTSTSGQIGAQSSTTVITLAGTGTYSYAGRIVDHLDPSISSTIALVKQGSGSQILSVNNAYRGDTTINGGILQLGDGSAGSTGLGFGAVENNASLVFDEGLATTISNNISGTGTVTQKGIGALTLSGSNSYSGGTILQSGTIIIGSNNALGTGALTTVDPTVVYMNGVTMTNPIIMEADTELQVNGTDSATQSGVISESGTVAAMMKTGTGKLILSGANTYSGGTTISSGTLAINVDSTNDPDGFVTGGGLGRGDVDIAADATLQINAGHGAGVNGLTGTAGSLINFSDAGNFASLLVNVATGTNTYAGNIVSNSNGTAVLVKAGSGALALSGTNTIYGIVLTQQGELDLNSSTALSSDASLEVASGATVRVNGVNVTVQSLAKVMGGDGDIVLNGGGITVAGVNAVNPFGGNISGTGSFTINASGNKQTLSGTNTYSGDTTITLGQLIAGSTTALSANSAFNVNGTLDLHGFSNTVAALSGSGTVTNSGGTGKDATLTIGGTASTTFNGLIKDGANAKTGLALTGHSQLSLTGSNTYIGGTSISIGTIIAANSNALGTGTVVLSNGGSLVGKDAVTIGNAIGLGASGGNLGNYGTGSTPTFTGSISLNGQDLTIFASSDATSSTTVTGGISGTGNVSLSSGTSPTDAASVFISGADVNNTGTITNLGTGTGGTTISANIGSNVTHVIQNSTTSMLILSGANTYSGGTDVSAGVLQVDSNTALGTGTVTVFSGATLSVTLGASLANNITISGTGTTGQGAIYGAGTLHGLVTLAADSSLTGATLFVGSVQLNDYTLTANGTVFLNGPITGSGGLIIAGNQVFISSSGNSYTGLTLVKSGSELVIHNGGGIAISGDLAIEDGAIVYQDQASDTIASTSVLTIEGSGVYQLSDASGETQTLAGLQSTSTLAIVEGHTAEYSLGSAYQVTLGGTGIYSYAGVIRDYDNGGFSTMALVKTGMGTQILSGTNSYSGGTTINAGTLVVGSATALGVGDVTLNGGTLTTTQTGTGIHLAIGGNYAQGADGTLGLNIYGADNFDSLSLTGTGVVSLNGKLQLNILNGFAPGQGQSFTIMTSSETVSGSFSSIATNLASIGVRADYSNDVTVLFQKPFVGLDGLTLTPNQTAVATYIDTYDLHITNPAFADLVGALNSVSNDPAALQSAFNQLSPLNFANFASSNAFNNASFTVQALDGYLANHRGADGTFVGSDGGIDYSGLAVNDPNVDAGLQGVRSRLLAWSPAPSTGLLSDSGSLLSGGMYMKNVTGNISPTNLWNVFITGNVILAQDFSDPSSGLPYNHTTTGAAQIGVDYKLTPHLLIGVAFGYGHTHANLDSIGSNANVNTYSPAAYLSYSNNGWYYNALGSYGFSDYSQNRNVQIGGFNGTAHSSPGGNQIIGDLDGGYDFHKGNWTFGPTLGLQYTHLDIDGYSETGLPGADLTVNSNQADSLRSHLGGRISYAVKSGSTLFTPHLSASWQHEFMDQSRGITSQFNAVGAGSFNVNTPNPSRESALVDVGVDAQINNTITVFSDYSAQAGQSNYFGQSIQAGVKIGF